MEKLKELFGKIYNSDDLKNHQYGDDVHSTVYDKFTGGYGYIQQDETLMREIVDEFVIVARSKYIGYDEHFDYRTECGNLNTGGILGRIIGDCYREDDDMIFINMVWRKLGVMGGNFREVGQPHFVYHPEKIEGGSLNKYFRNQKIDELLEEDEEDTLPDLGYLYNASDEMSDDDFGTNSKKIGLGMRHCLRYLEDAGIIRLSDLDGRSVKEDMKKVNRVRNLNKLLDDTNLKKIR